METNVTIKRIYLEGWFDSVKSVRDIEVFQESLKLPNWSQPEFFSHLIPRCTEWHFPSTVDGLLYQLSVELCMFFQLLRTEVSFTK